MCGSQSLSAFIDRIFVRLLCLFIAFIPLLFRLTNANCSQQFFFREDNVPNEGHAVQQPFQNLSWTFVEDTKQCDAELASLLSNDNLSDYRQQQQLDQPLLVSPCVDQLLDIELTPFSVFPVGKNVLPYVQLNISVNTFSSVDQLFFRFRCIYAPNSDDYLCHNHNIQLRKWGQMIWPCRQLRIIRHQRFSVPQFHFSYTCFRLFSLSQYSIEFFLLNRNELCRRELIFTIPMEQQLDPKILNFYEAVHEEPGQGRALIPPPNWSPLLAVDTSFSDCLFIQLHPSEWLTRNQQHRPRTVEVTVFSTLNNESISTDKNGSDEQHGGEKGSDNGAPDREQHRLDDEDYHAQSSTNNNIHNNLSLYKKQHWQSQQQFLFSQKVPFLGRNANTRKQSNFYRWAWIDVDAGNYTLFAFVDHGDCHLTCPTEERANEEHQKCRICLHTALNFTLTVAKHSAEWHKSILMSAFARNANFCVLGILFFLLIALVVAFLYVRIWRPRALARLPPHHVELDGRCPTVLVLYTDDCQEHSDAVLALCRTLEECANAKCFVDQWEFMANPTLRPSLWLVEKLTECDFVLVIFSACSARVMAGDQLVQRLHFPDLFNSGLGFVVAQIREIASSEGVTLPQHHHQNGHVHHHSMTNCQKKIVSTKQCQAILSAKNAATNGQSLLSRFVFARFACVDPSVIPPFFASSQFSIGGTGGPLVLPDQIGLLIARLHGIVDSTAIEMPIISLDQKEGQMHRQRFLHEADLSQLNASLERLRQFMETNSNWMEQRFINSNQPTEEKKGREEGERNDEGKAELVGTAHDTQQPHLANKFCVPTIDEQAQIIECYGLLAVEEEEEDKSEHNRGGANSKRYRLLAMEEEEEEEEEMVE